MICAMTFERKEKEGVWSSLTSSFPRNRARKQGLAAANLAGENQIQTAPNAYFCSWIDGNGMHPIYSDSSISSRSGSLFILLFLGSAAKLECLYRCSASWKSGEVGTLRLLYFRQICRNSSRASCTSGVWWIYNRVYSLIL